MKRHLVTCAVLVLIACTAEPAIDASVPGINIPSTATVEFFFKSSGSGGERLERTVFTYEHGKLTHINYHFEHFRDTLSSIDCTYNGTWTITPDCDTLPNWSNKPLTQNMPTRDDLKRAIRSLDLAECTAGPRCYHIT